MIQHPRHLSIADYDYDLPLTQIARYPAAARDASRLLIYRQGVIRSSRYHNLAQYLPSGSLLVLNETSVIQARLLFRKPTGGLIEIFCLEPHSQYPDIQTAMAQQEIVRWQCLVGGASKWNPESTLSLSFPGGVLHATAEANHSGVFTIAFRWDDASFSFAAILEAAGRMPLPPYLNREAEAADKQTYQTIYARHKGSVAAPTAGLHFTEGIMQSLSDRHIETAFVTLHVGAGTFMPVKAETMADHEMHAEWISVDRRLIERLLTQTGSVVAVGTTSLRTLESLYWIGVKLICGQQPNEAGIAVSQWDVYDTDHRGIAVKQSLSALLSWMRDTQRMQLTTRTQLLIAPGYQFRIADGLITNFHQPGSTLLLLVAAVTGTDWRMIYNYALQHNYRFLSYGDGSLLWVKQNKTYFHPGRES